MIDESIYFLFSNSSTDGETDLNAPVWLAMVLITIFLTFDAVVFMFMEKWNFGTSLYFIFITLTTIGFGDIVPHNSEVCDFFTVFFSERSDRVSPKKLERFAGCRANSTRPTVKTEMLIYQAKANSDANILRGKNHSSFRPGN